MNRLTGLYAAPYTAFNDDDNVNLDIIGDQCAALAANGVSGAIVCGTTGESSSMTIEERMIVLDKWCETARDFPEVTIISHVGHTSLKDCIELTRHAADAGADVIASLPPYYFKPNSISDLLDFIAQTAAAAPELPFYYYHMPAMTGVGFDVFSILSELRGRIPNFAGVKYTYEDLYDLARCLDLENGRYDILCGRDQILLACMALGTKGAVGSTYNYIAPVYTKLIEAFETGDLKTAQEMQRISREVIAVVDKNGGMAAAKQIMKLLDLDCGQARLPLPRISDEEFENLKAELYPTGFYENFSISPHSAVLSHVSEG